MKHRSHNEAGSLLLPLVVVFVLLLGSLGFGAWAFIGRQDYKTNSDKKAAAVAKKAVVVESARKDAEFAEKEKSPSKTYAGPATYGSLKFDYPKTWSAYISETGKSPAVDGYFSPNFVPDLLSGTLFALRIQIVNTEYVTVLKTFDSSVKTGKTSVSAYRAPKVQSALGSIIVGAIDNKREGTLVILPLRDKTIKIWTEGNDYVNDFNNTVLSSLTFIP